MKKRIILITIIGLFLMMLPLMAGAEIVDSGSCGTNDVSYTLDDEGVLTINGSGEITSCPWAPNRICQLVIENGVTGICEKAFYSCKNLTKVLTPSSLTHIDNNAFNNCTSLSDIYLSEGLKYIGDYVFNYCDSLNSITIPDSVESVGLFAPSTSNIIIYAHFDSDGAKALGKNHYSFRETNWSYSLKYQYINDEICGLSISKLDKDIVEFTIPDGVTEIGGGAFYNHTNLAKISIPAGVTTVGDGAFSGCTGLTTLVFPDSVTSIGESALFGCSNLEKITIKGVLSFLGDRFINDCSALKTLEIMTPLPIHNTIECRNCNQLESVRILEGSTSILDNNLMLFTKCFGLQIYTPNSLTNIEPSAFSFGSYEENPRWTIMPKCNSYTYFWLKERVNYYHKYKTVDHLEVIIDPAVETTCAEEGWTEGSHCGVCNEIIIQQDRIEKLSHTLIEHDGITATNLNEGIERYWECSACGKLFSNSLAFDEYEINEPIIIPIDPRYGTWELYMIKSTYEDGSEHTSYNHCGSSGIERKIYIANQKLYRYEGNSIDYSSKTDIVAYEEGYQTFGYGQLNYDHNKSRWYYQYSNGRISETFFHSRKYDGEWHDSCTVYTYLREGLRDRMHSLLKYDLLEPTCESQGTEEYWRCTICGKMFSDEAGTNEITNPVSIPVKVHTLIKHNRVEPTFATTGIDKYWECTECGKLFSDENGENEISEPVIIPAKTHTLIKHDRVEPTYITTGTEEYWECTECGKLFSDEDAINEIESPVMIPKLEKIKISKAKSNKIPNQEYTGKAVKPKVTITYDGNTLTEGTDYTLTYKNNKKIGKATITIKGKGAFTGTKKATFSIVPKSVKLSSLKAGKNQLTVKWKKGSNIDGYEIQYGLKKNFKSAKKVTITKAKTTNTVIKKLKEGKTYYVRIRAFKKVSGKKYYSEWSKALSKKIK